MATIYFNREKYETGDSDKDFYVMALTGDTFQAKDIIKGLGFTFSDQTGYGKAWRSSRVLVKDLAGPGGDKMRATVKSAHEALRAAGYKIVLR